MTSAYAMPKVGDVIAAKYRLEKVAGEGGMGLVYAAEHLVLKQRVAVKVLLPDAATSEAIVERFSREAQAAARIQSEHVARVMDAGSLANGAPFLVMEYLEGCDLEELLELQGTLPVSEVADTMLQALEALAHAHAVGLVHRDLKPANLFLACRPDGGNVIKMLDFGISKSVKATPGEKRLTGQHVLGSPIYMSPEQLRNAKEIDGRADIWSLGVVAYELLTGTTPFDGDGVGEIFAAILEKEPVPIHERNPKVPAELAEIIAKCLRRDPAERWADAAELARAVAPFGTGAWSALVDRAEQVLARAKMLNTVATPLETRRVVEAIEAAAVRARITGASMAPPPSSSARRKDDLKKTGDMGFVTRSTALTPASRWIGVAGVAGVIVAIVAVVSAIRSSPSATGSPGPVAATAVRHVEADTTAAGVAHAASPAPASADSADVLMDLPDNAPRPNASAPKRQGKPGKPGPRPKFLNTRE